MRRGGLLMSKNEFVGPANVQDEYPGLVNRFLWCLRGPFSESEEPIEEGVRLCCADEPLEESFGTIVLRHVNIGSPAATTTN
jgi:hypothetical protein